MNQALGSRAVGGAIVPRGELFERLAGAGRVTVLSAPAGSGKTSLLRSWIVEAELAERVGWVSVQRGEHDPQRFLISVLDALRDTSAGCAAVRALTPAPNLDGGAIVERLLEDLGSLEDPLWLVIDDLHELRSGEAQRQLALLLLRPAPQLRFVLSVKRARAVGLLAPSRSRPDKAYHATADRYDAGLAVAVRVREPERNRQAGPNPSHR